MTVILVTLHCILMISVGRFHQPTVLPALEIEDSFREGISFYLFLHTQQVTQECVCYPSLPLWTGFPARSFEGSYLYYCQDKIPLIFSPYFCFSDIC